MKKENESQKLYKTIMDSYAKISHIRRINITPRTYVQESKRVALARELSRIYYVSFNFPERLNTINAFAEHIKKYDMYHRMPQIEETVRDIVRLFFRNKEFAQDEFVFQNVPEPLHTTCVEIFKNEVSKRFEMDVFRGFGEGDIYLKDNEGFFKKDFSIKQVVEWIYLHEKQK